MSPLKGNDRPDTGKLLHNVNFSIRLGKDYMNGVFTSESVAAGHPDKICDQISDAIVDAALTADPDSRVAVETLVTKNRIILAGEVTCPATIAYETIVQNVVQSLGYTDKRFGFTDMSPLSVYIHQQSRDIAIGVDDGGAGDQGMMFGFACRETPEFMPLPIMLAHRMVERMDRVRTDKTMPYLRPDGKCEVTVSYEKNRPVSVGTVVIAVPHDPKICVETVKQDLIQNVVSPVLTLYAYDMPIETKIIVNGTGAWEIGGPASDTGVTGRKIIVDTYGAFARHGGGAFSGKDPSKVDRSGAYACRFIAKNIVAAGLADTVEVRIAYAIGVAEPVAFAIDTFGTAKKTDTLINDFARNIMSLTPQGIIEGLDLKQPIYQNTARYGHFGKNGLPWERIVC